MIRVKSRFRAPWSGILINLDERNVATVLVILDRNGNRIPKPKFHYLHVDWLQILGSKKQHCRHNGLFEEIPEAMRDDADMIRVIQRACGRTSKFKIKLPVRVDI